MYKKSDFIKKIIGFSKFNENRILKFLSFINLPLGRVRSHKKFGSDLFSRFDVYWTQTDRQSLSVYYRYGGYFIYF